MTGALENWYAWQIHLVRSLVLTGDLTLCADTPIKIFLVCGHVMTAQGETYDCYGGNLVKWIKQVTAKQFLLLPCNNYYLGLEVIFDI